MWTLTHNKSKVQRSRFLLHYFQVTLNKHICNNGHVRSFLKRTKCSLKHCQIFWDLHGSFDFGQTWPWQLKCMLPFYFLLVELVLQIVESIIKHCIKTANWRQVSFLTTMSSFCCPRARQVHVHWGTLSPGETDGILPDSDVHSQPAHRHPFLGLILDQHGRRSCPRCPWNHHGTHHDNPELGIQDIFT